ncbi:MAG: hypothetical protein HZB57_12040 [Gammaproteobacteria bacterium]|nr:hypothetical protein [Gammaproteobacteria bacterium]
MPCGFARIDFPFDSSEESTPDASHVVPFELTLDEEGGTVAFVVDPDSDAPIQSDTAPALILPPVVFTYPGGSSDLSGPITRDEAGNPVVAQGMWDNTSYGSDESAIVNGGEFVWGITATANEMQSLISGLGSDTIAVYQGMTMGITNGNEGAVRLEVNFDASTWRGEFNNNAFTASGDVIGSGFVSDAKGFSENIASGEVKGGFVNAGHNAIGGYEVKDVEGIKSADVFSTTLQDERVY